ncbi:hypothetical protein B0H34DRAFT_737924 [Crassisporium funariophilum]|nr:hypothetical protein B0H34DRAFT_737924 [Crassisporium funariophilum]
MGSGEISLTGFSTCGRSNVICSTHQVPCGFGFVNVMGHFALLVIQPNTFIFRVHCLLCIIMLISARIGI